MYITTRLYEAFHTKYDVEKCGIYINLLVANATAPPVNYNVHCI